MSRTTYLLDRYLPTKIFSSVLSGRFRITWLNPSQYFYDIRTAGDPAPDTSEYTTWTRLDSENFEFYHNDRVDVYVYSESEDGRIIADTDGPYVDVKIQDQTTEIVDLHLFRNDGTFEIASPVAIDDTSLTVIDATGITAGTTLCFQEGTAFMQADVLTVVGTTLTIDTPFDFPFTTSGGCSFGTNNLAVDGSVAPQIFSVSPKNLVDGARWDIVRLMISITSDTAMDDGKFGGIPKLTKGIVIRAKDGIHKNIFNAKSNGDFGLHNYDAQYVDDTLGPAGLYGFRSRRTFGGQNKNGVVIRLNAITDDEIQVIVQDDLTGLESFEAVVQGHVVD
jgi:hypothetical protein